MVVRSVAAMFIEVGVFRGYEDGPEEDAFDILRHVLPEHLPC
jgi:hypothetical protein